MVDEQEEEKTHDRRVGKMLKHFTAQINVMGCYSKANVSNKQHHLSLLSYVSRWQANVRRIVCAFIVKLYSFNGC